MLNDNINLAPQDPSYGGLPRYSYDPQTQQYTQLQSALPDTQMSPSGTLAQLLRQLNLEKTPTDTMYRYSFDPASQQYTRLKDGGIARAEAAGRGGDDRLVHMSSRELEALRALARRHGRDLTVNPETGLPEAFKLKDILPVAATGAALFFAPEIAAFGGSIGEGLGLSGALAQGVGMGLLSGGITTALTGDIKKGATAGLLSGLTAGALYNPAAASTAAVPTSNVQTAIPAGQAVSSPIIDASPAQVTQIQPIVPTGGATPVPSAPPVDFPDGISQGPMAAGVSQSVSGTNYPVGPGGLTGADWEQMPEYSAMQQVQPTDQGGLGSKFMNWWGGLSPKEKMLYGGSAVAAAALLAPKPKYAPPTIDKGTIRPYTYTRTPATPSPYMTGPTYGASGLPVLDTRERNYFNDYYTALPTYKAAAGGAVPVAPTGPVERMSQNVLGAGGMYPQSQMEKTYFATPTQMPASAEVIAADYDAKTDPFTGMPTAKMAGGGLPPFGGYSDGGRLLKGPGDGVSDDIPATISGKQPARLADGEFVIPSRIVSELGNGSTDAGAKRLYAMMDRVQKARQKSAKKGKFAIDTKADKYLPA